MSKYVFGNIKDYKIGHIFKDRRELFDSGLHGHLQAGITGKSSEGACAIVLSGGYGDDRDEIDQILYTGDSGGRDEKGNLTKNQQLSPGNSGLIESYINQLPIRVIRGHQTKYGPTEGYRYDGLYFVNDYEYLIGNDGYLIYQFNLLSENSYETLKNAVKTNIKPELKWPERKEITVNRIIRDKGITDKIKNLYNNTCQVCLNPVIGKKNGYISIGAHIEPLGQPFLGPDVLSNMLCLCPNHHSMFDDYGFYINDDMSIKIDEILNQNPKKLLNVHKDHAIDIKYLINHKNRAMNYEN